MNLDFEAYQAAASRTAVYPDRGHNLAYPTLGLCGETGEVAEKIKKVLRDKGGMLDEPTRRQIEKELGDVLWYVAALCDEVGLNLQTVAETNIAKLADRKARAVLHGSGDER